MTKLAATAGATPEETLATAEAVPSVEGVDINDGWIIDQTQQIDCGGGLMKYAIKLLDGSPFECTPFRIEHKRDMVKMWMGAVRQAIVERAGAAMAATREAALKGLREKQMASAGIVVADTVPTAAEAAQLAQALKPAPADPVIADRIVHSMRELKQAVAPSVPSGGLAEAKQQLAQAKAHVAYWRAMVKALEV